MLLANMRCAVTAISTGTVIRRISNYLEFFLPKKEQRRKGRRRIKVFLDSLRVNPLLPEARQNLLILQENLAAEKISVVLVPEHASAMSGGIYSFFMLASQLKKNKDAYGHDVLVMTRPSRSGSTYLKQENFYNDWTVYRFEQITIFKNLKELVIHVPEESCASLLSLLTRREIKFLSSIKNVKINIMNQNILLMPERQEFSGLYKITGNISQTTAHHRYCSQEMADKYGIKTQLIPPFTDLSAYPKLDFSAKENVILYSPDNNPWKERIIAKMKNDHPDYRLVEIRGLTFHAYMRLVTNSKFMITFGEGMDGYFSQSILQNGIGFCVYNDDFFPKGEDFSTKNVFSSYEDMYEKITEIINDFCHDVELRNSTIMHYSNMQARLYNSLVFAEAVGRFCKDDFDFYPLNSSRQHE